MLAAVAPPTDVNALDPTDAVNGTLDADDERAELGLMLRRQPVEVAMLAWIEEHDDGKSTRPRQRRDEPVLVAPDRVLVAGRAAPAVDAALALARRVLGRRAQRPCPDLPLEREGLPLVERRDREAAVLVGGGECPSVELLG
jgi:hypothetical protein